MGYLTQTLKTKNKTIVTDLIEAVAGGFTPARPYLGLHASDVTKESFCERKFTLMHSLNIARKDEYLPFTLKMTFDEGNDKQSRINNDYLKNHMLGFWECPSCHTVSDFGGYTGNCYVCHMSPRYKEPYLRHTKSLLQGSIDGVVKTNKAGTKGFPIEVKIMALSQFAKLKAPLAEHRTRCKIYLHLIANSIQEYSSNISSEKCHIIYVLRGHGKKDVTTGSISPLREYVIERDDEEIQPYLDKAHRITGCVSYNKSTLEIPDIIHAPDGICSSPSDACAKQCEVKDACFSGKIAVEVQKNKPLKTITITTLSV